MSLYFDAKKQVFRITIVKGGTRIRKALPKSTTEESAREIHARLLNDVHKLHHRSGEIAGWGSIIDAAVADPKSWMAMALKKAESRSKRAGRPFRLSMADFEFICRRSGGRCEVTGLPFSDEIIGPKSTRPFRQSLDRIDSSREYCIDNCRLVGIAVNLAMWSCGEEALHRIATGLILNRFYPPWLDADTVKIHTGR